MREPGRVETEKRRDPPSRFKPLLALASVVTAMLLLNFIVFVRNMTGDGASQSLQRKTSVEGNKHQQDRGEPDGYFNNLPVHYHRAFGDRFHSTAHCLGENFVDAPARTANNAWKYRSCRFQNLCFDLIDRDFVLFVSPEQAALREALGRAGAHQFWPADRPEAAVAVGGVHPRFGGKDVALRWYPQLRNVSSDDSIGFYALPSDHVLVPWNSFHGFNPGHIITDDFLPIYTLLASFGLTDLELAMIHIDLPLKEGDPWWDSCQNHWQECKPYLAKFLPLIGTQLHQTSTQHTATLEVTHGGGLRSRYVCAGHGVAGMGMLTDHGKKLHGNFEKDFLWTHNVGRAESFYRFRNWMVGRLLGANIEGDLAEPPYLIVISNNSSSDSVRNTSFKEHAAALQWELGEKYPLEIRQITVAELSLAEQVKLAAETSVLVTAAGGGASLAHFLPRGASLLLFFVEFPPDKEVTTGAYNGWVMDWDTYNNFGYVRAHWLPLRCRGNATAEEAAARGAADMDVFVKLVDQELDIISHLNG